MKSKKVYTQTSRKNPSLIKLLICNRIFLALIFCIILVGLSSGFAFAQTNNFLQTGQIRPIVSETETDNAAWKNNPHDGGIKIPGGTNSKLDFYFTYSAFEKGVSTEKWVALPNDRAWNRLSNQTVRISGSLKKNKLSNITMSPLTELSEDYLTGPPPTVGLYKVVAVPMTIQTQSAQGKPDKEQSVLDVTPEAIRDTLFNAPDAVNKFYLEASYGKFGIGGVNHPQVDVVPVTIQATISSNCQEQIISEFTPIVQERLLDQNIDTTNGSVDLGIIIFNNTPGCPPYPFTTRGALGQRGVTQWLWMPESSFVTGPAILAHEMGHTLGGNHPVAVQCTNFDDPQTCTYVDAADRDIMTSAGRFYMMPNNYERRRWGWHFPGAFENPASGSVYLYDLQSPTLAFGKDGTRRGRYYFRSLSGAWSGWNIYPEARRNWGQFDRYQAADESFHLGIAIRFGHSNYGNPDATTLIMDPNDTPGLEDAPLRKDQQFSIGGTLIKCIREHNPNWGTRMRVE